MSAQNTSAPRPVSNHWKTRFSFFQSLEKIAGTFPIIGKAGFLWLALGLAADAQAAVYTNTIAHMTAWITNAMAAEQITGVSIALVDDQEVVWAQGFGYADVEALRPVTTDTVFRIGSVSKVFTAAAAMQLKERGLLDLDAPYTNYLPGANGLPRYTNAPAITVRNLLDHHSGLPGDLFRGAFSTAPFGGGFAWSTNHLAETYSIYPPNFVYSYCNLGFTLMEGVLENASGSASRFPGLVESNLFIPLGMEATSFLKDKTIITNQLAMPYIDGARMPEEFVNIYGTGALYSRPRDMARFLFLLFSNGMPGVLSSNSLDEMASWQASNVVFDMAQDLRVGLGWDAVRWPALDYAGRVCFKNGATLGYSAVMGGMLDKKLGVAIVCSKVAALPNAGFDEALRWALLDKTGEHWPTNAIQYPVATQAVSQAELEALAGIYVGGAGYDQIEAGPGVLHYRRNLPAGASVMSNLTLRTNGWFMSDAMTSMMLCFTNLQGRPVVFGRRAQDYYELRQLFSERYAPPALSAAWSNRIGKTWYVRNEAVDSYLPLVGCLPDLTLLYSNGVLYVTGGLAGNHALIPTNDSTAFVAGLNNRGDSAFQAHMDGANESVIHMGYHYGPAPEVIPVQAAATGGITVAGEARWYEVAPAPPAEAVGGVSSVYYTVSLSGAPSNFLLRVYEHDGVTPVARRQGDGALEVASGASPLLLNLQPGVEGAQTGVFQAAFSVPLLLRGMRAGPTGFEQVWQGPTGAVYTLESAEFLAPFNTFAPLLEHVPAAGLLSSQTIPAAPDASRFYRMAGEASGRLGKAAILSDIHLSPFLDRATTEALADADIGDWDGFFAANTNGFFLRDATGQRTTTPLLFNSALTNLFAACPRPDAILIPGDFPYYDFVAYYTNITQSADIQKGRGLLVKNIRYILMKIRQTFPETPVYFTLGNNDTFLGDYEIDPSGDAFYAATAPAFYDGPFTNLVGYADFAATYTNGGHYAAPLGSGDFISVQSLYFSASYPHDLSSGSNQLAWLEARLDQSAAAGRKAWLLMHIPPGVNAYATWGHWATGDTSHASTDWRADFMEPFCRMIASHSNTIAGVLCGHYHNRGWRVISDPVHSNALVDLQIANGLLFNHGANPGFTVLTYDRNTLALVQENTYSLDYTTWQGSLNAAAPWSLRFSQNQGLNLADLSVTNLMDAWAAMAGFGSQGAQYYNNEYTGGRLPLICTASNWPVYYNAIRWMLPRHFLENARP